MAGPLRALSRSLFAAGVHGAWSFPQAAPLALVTRPLTPAALQSLAVSLRSETLRAPDGKITLGPPALVSCPGFPGFFGPVLDLPPPPLPYPGLRYSFPRLVLCTGLVAPGDEAVPGTIRDIPPVNPAFFRAAMVANLTIKPLVPDPSERFAYPAENYSFIWRTGKPRWLPSPRRANSKEGS
jgi:hypothetical protein